MPSYILPIPGFKGRTFQLWALNRWVLNFCVGSTLLWVGTHGRDCLTLCLLSMEAKQHRTGRPKSRDNTSGELWTCCIISTHCCNACNNQGYNELLNQAKPISARHKQRTETWDILHFSKTWPQDKLYFPKTWPQVYLNKIGRQNKLYIKSTTAQGTQKACTKLCGSSCILCTYKCTHHTDAQDSSDGFHQSLNFLQNCMPLFSSHHLFSYC